MNKDSNEGPKIIEGFVHHNNDRFYGTPGIRVRVIEFGDAKWDTRDIPATLVIGSKAIPEGAVVKIREKADKWDELRKNLDFYESGVDENGNGIEDKNLKDLLVRTVEKVVFAHWETTPRK